MAITLTGFAQAFIKNISIIAKENDSQTKLTPVGFLKLLLEHNATAEINNIEELRKGHKKTIKLRYLQRGLESEVSDVDSCDTPISADWKETQIADPSYSQIGIFISDDEFRQWEEEASQTLTLGDSQSVALMRGLYEVVLTKLPGLISKIDSNLVAAQSAKWGKNIAYNPATGAKTLHLGKSADFNNGYVKLQEDALRNEVNGNLLLCGNGLITRYDIFSRLKTNPDSFGFGALPLNAYYDPRTINAWGEDHFGVFAEGSVGFIDWNRYVGSFAGEKGGSVFFTLPIPVEIDGGLTSLVLDAQLKYIDCPSGEVGQDSYQPRGYKLILSKHYGLFTLPNNLYQSGDVLNGVNGAFHYVAAVEGTDPSSDSSDSASE